MMCRARESPTHSALTLVVCCCVYTTHRQLLQVTSVKANEFNGCSLSGLTRSKV